MWTVTFRSSCTDSTGLVTTGRCQGYNGHEALFVADTSQVRFSSSAYFEQERPAINVVRSFAGRHGNVRATSAADMASLAFTLTPRNYTARGGTEAPRAIGMQVQQLRAFFSPISLPHAPSPMTTVSRNLGMQVQQLLACSASGPGATFSLVVVNDTVPVHSWYTPSDLQKALNPGTGLPSNSSAPGVTVAVALQTRSPPQVPKTGLGRVVTTCLTMLNCVLSLCADVGRDLRGQRHDGLHRLDVPHPPWRRPAPRGGGTPLVQ